MKNLKELQQKKEELKSRLAANKDSGPVKAVQSIATTLNAPPVKNAMSLLGIGNNKQKQQKGIMYDAAKTVVTLGTTFLVSQLKLKGITKFVVTTAVGLATPYIMDFLDKKFNLSNKHKALPDYTK